MTWNSGSLCTNTNLLSSDRICVESHYRYIVSYCKVIIVDNGLKWSVQVAASPHHLPAHTVSSQDQEARTITCLPPYQVQRQTSPTVLFLLKDFQKKVQNIIVKRLTDTSR